MGADFFTTAASGATAEEAFRNAVEQAEYDYGHAGYTGTIAEKDSFIPFPEAPTLEEALSRIEQERNNEESPVDDKWGPAGCIHISGSKKYIFFGWASS